MHRVPLALAALAAILAVRAGAAEPAPSPGVCRADAERLCGDLPPGLGDRVRCLRGHGDRVSPGCREAMTPHGD